MGVCFSRSQTAPSGGAPQQPGSLHVAHTVNGSGIYFLDGSGGAQDALPHQDRGVAVHQPTSHLTVPPRSVLASSDTVTVVNSSNPAAAEHVYFIENDVS